MKINFGAGRRVLDGFYNVDAIHNRHAPRAPELIHAVEFTPDGSVRNPLPLADSCADLLQAMHVIEHVYAWEAPALLREWRRLLRPGGLLVLELPNIEAAARNLLAGKPEQMWLWPMTGDPSHRDPFMMHKHCYTPKSIQALVANCGFDDIKFLLPQTHGPRPDRDMRVEARKPE